MNFVSRRVYFDVSDNLQTKKETDTKITTEPYCSGSVEKSRSHVHTLENNQPRLNNKGFCILKRARDNSICSSIKETN